MIGKSNKPNSNSFNIVILNWRESIKQHEESQVQPNPFTTNLVHSMLTEINILYPFLLALALYIINYSTRA